MISGEDYKNWCSIELPLGDAAETFDLEKAVCSHGFFMMFPNRWDPLSRSLSRPLRLPPSDFHGELDGVDGGGVPYSSAVVRITRHPELPCLSVQVFGVSSLSESQRRAIVVQVSRMLRLSPTEEVKIKEFVKLMMENGAEELLGCFGGRVFRSPTLFEDMVKCIILCNCQWARTLKMAKSLCELQLELQSRASSACPASAAGREDTSFVGAGADTKYFIPKTPVPKELKRKKHLRAKNVSARLRKKLDESNVEMECDGHVSIKNAINFQSSEPCQDYDAEIGLVAGDCCNEVLEDHSFSQVGNFPSPKELASLDEDFLAKRCNLGYRASRILKLARGIVEDKIQLRELEKACAEPNLSAYDSLLELLRKIDGFGPFTCANVLMCMGFYHVIPTDSETIRHLKQVHAKQSSIQTVTNVVETVYGKYAPFQFLAYWAEVWHFYEQWFGKLSEMSHTDYRLITASNMRSKKPRKNKKIKSS